MNGVVPFPPQNGLSDLGTERKIKNHKITKGQYFQTFYIAFRFNFYGTVWLVSVLTS